MRTRAAAALAASLGTVACLLLPAIPAAAASPCVGVVVDARLAGGQLRTGCADGDPDSGLEALSAAGFTYAFVPRVPGMVCSIDAVPECSRTGTDTYWSYWYRDKGSDTWVYSSTGAGTRDPEPGAMEAWVWQDGGRQQPPDVTLAQACPQVRKRPSTPAAPRTTSAAPTTAAPSPTASATTATRATKPSRRKGAGSTPASSAGTTPPAVPSTSAASTTTATSGTAAATRPTAPPSGADQPPVLGLAVGALLVAGLAGATWWRARHRRPDQP